MIILVGNHDQRLAPFLAHASTEETGFSIRLAFDMFCTFCLYDFDFMLRSRNSIFWNENSLKGVLKEENEKKLEEKYDKSSWNSNVIKKWKIVDDFVRTYVIMAIQMNRMYRQRVNPFPKNRLCQNNHLFNGSKVFYTTEAYHWDCINAFVDYLFPSRNLRVRIRTENGTSGQLNGAKYA